MSETAQGPIPRTAPPPVGARGVLHELARRLRVPQSHYTDDAHSVGTRSFSCCGIADATPLMHAAFDS